MINTTLSISQNDVFAYVLDKYFNGERDNRTINIITTSNETI